MASPTGIIPAELITRSKKAEVIAWLQTTPLRARERRKLLLGWAIEVGVRLNSADYAKANEGAPDRQE